jgi:hypothetical protein
MPTDPKTIATPEGDNEIPPDAPLKPGADRALDGLETPAGSAPDPYKEDLDKP